MHAKIEAINFFGARNGLETLFQLIIFDNVKSGLFIVDSADITDKPQFKHRGMSLDTSRNFFPIEALKRTINGMGMVKLNTFHWHMSDSQSFPIALKSHPDLSEFSMYSVDKVYTPENIIELTKYARARGVRIVPEIDIPGHVGEGFYMKNLTSCYSSQISEPCKGAHPCGQVSGSSEI